jgi:hypothetical protein
MILVDYYYNRRLGTSLLSLPLPQSPYFLERFVGLRHTL